MIKFDLTESAPLKPRENLTQKYLQVQLNIFNLLSLFQKHKEKIFRHPNCDLQLHLQ